MMFTHAAVTDVGRVREHNEDDFVADESLRLFAVADGMGGRAAGEIASRIAVETLRQTVHDHRDVVLGYDGGKSGAKEMNQVLGAAMHGASRAVLHAARERPDRRGMGTTLTAVLLTADRCFAAHVGDSRLYLVRDKTCHQLTRDHTLLDELVLTGHMSREEAESEEMQRLSNVLARAVGVAADIAVDAFSFELLPGDVLVLASDGLVHYFDDDEIAGACQNPPERAAQGLVRAAVDRGGHDNVTTIVVRAERPAPAEGGGPPELDPRTERFRERLEALATVPVFDDLSVRVAFQLALHAESVEYREGETILREEQASGALFVVITGSVRVAGEGGGPGGEELVRGQWFGESSLVDRWVRAPAAIALSATRLVKIGRDALNELGRREPEIYDQVLAAFARSAARRARSASAPPGA